MNKTIGVIGCGNMGAALLSGLIRRRTVAASRVMVADADTKKLRAVSRSLRVKTTTCNCEAAGQAVVLLAVKPQQMEPVLKEIRSSLAHRPLLISIAAGLSTAWIEKQAGGKIPVVRVMPNTPALIGKGISAVARGRYSSAAHEKLALEIFRSVGETVVVSEKAMDAVTAVSGSGPAYFFFLMEQMITAGKRLGLRPEMVRTLVLATAEGASQLALQSNDDPSVLRQRVTSKGGTTEAALKVFEKKKVAQAIQQAILAAARRARQLGK